MPRLWVTDLSTTATSFNCTKTKTHAMRTHSHHSHHSIPLFFQLCNTNAPFISLFLPRSQCSTHSSPFSDYCIAPEKREFVFCSYLNICLQGGSSSSACLSIFVLHSMLKESITTPLLICKHIRLWMMCMCLPHKHRNVSWRDTCLSKIETYNELWEHVIDEVVLLTLARVVFARSSVHIVR